MTEKEKITIFRRIWKVGGGKYAIYIPKQIIAHYKLQGKFVKGTLEVIEDGTESADET